MKRYFVTAIGTNSGKTLVAAILCKALNAAYWKPIQAGLPRDYDTVARLLGDAFYGYKETYILKEPIAPHIAAQAEGIVLRKEDLVPPKTHRPLVIEGAGGCMVPLNRQDYMMDLATHLNAKLILVANLYLGAINHTLLTVRALPKGCCSGLVINGPEDKAVEKTLCEHTGLPLLLRVYPEKNINTQTIIRYSKAVATKKIP